MKIQINQPGVPNFLQIRIGNEKETTTVSVQSFTEEQLREVGRQWIEDLVAKSKRRI